MARPIATTTIIARAATAKISIALILSIDIRVSKGEHRLCAESKENVVKTAKESKRFDSVKSERQGLLSDISKQLQKERQHHCETMKW